MRFRAGLILVGAALAAAAALRCKTGPAAQDETIGPAEGEPRPDGAAPSPDDEAKKRLQEKRRAWKPPRFTERQDGRDAMVRVIRGYGLRDKAVLGAMAAVPRHEFVPARYQDEAHHDSPLPIGHGQTISQPYMVAEMTRLLDLKRDAKVLEVGTGSGYQAAALTEFTPYVYTIEIIKPLAESARQRLSRLGYDVVQVRQGDGYDGWPEEGPFDAIIVTCAAGQVPPPLVRQLKVGGRMVVPVGGRFATQTLMLVEKQEDGTVRSRDLMAVRFVPLERRDTSRE